MDPKYPFHSRLFGSLIIVIMLTTEPFSASAAQPPLPNAGQILQETKTPVKRPTVQEPSIPGQGSSPLATKSDTTKVKVNGFAFTGNTIFSSQKLSALLSPLIGTEMTIGELESSASAITYAYRQKGYFLAYAYIPPQTLKSGDPITIGISEGILDRIDVQSTPPRTRVARSILTGYASQAKPGEPVRESVLTSIAIKTNELPNITSKITLDPGSRPGTSRAVLDVNEGNLVNVILDADNFGNNATGNLRIGGTIIFNSPTCCGDQFMLRLHASTTGNMESLQSSYSIPVSSAGTTVKASFNAVHYELAEQFSSLNASGNAYDFILTLSHPLVINRKLILKSMLANEIRWLEDKLAAVDYLNKRHLMTLQAGITGQQMDNLMKGGTTGFSAGIVAGNLKFDNGSAWAEDLPPAGPDTSGGFIKLNGSLSRTQNFTRSLSLYLGTYGQWTNKNLDSSEQLGLGGPNAVRALLPDATYADRGLVSTAELRYLVENAVFLDGNIQLSTFIDHAYGELRADPINDTGTNKKYLTGAGVGLTWYKPGNFQLKASCAWVLNADDEPSDDPTCFLQAVKRF